MAYEGEVGRRPLQGVPGEVVVAVLLDHNDE